MQILAKPISELCNLSMALGSFPDAYKIAKVKPLFKRVSKTNPSNYRPKYDKIFKSFGDGLVTGMILIDLQKAFDSINHDMLVKKLSIIGFSDHTVKWF